MKIIVEEPRRFPNLGWCQECKHGTEPNQPCRWCGARRVDTEFSRDEEQERIALQNQFNLNVARGII